MATSSYVIPLWVFRVQWMGAGVCGHTAFTRVKAEATGYPQDQGAKEEGRQRAGGEGAVVSL